MTNILKTLIILSLIFFIFFFLFPRINQEYSGCKEYEDMLSENIKGTVIDKYIDDKNHNFKTIMIKETKESRKKILTQGYNSMFKQIEVGDSLIKKINEDFYTIKNKKKDYIIVFKNICKQ